MIVQRAFRKTIVFVLVCILFQMLCNTAFAEFDYKLFKEVDTFSVAEYPDENCAYVDTLFTAADTSFEHDYESETYYSYLYNDLIVFDYNTPAAYPIWRLWIEYSGSKHIYANAVTFSFGGKDYTFSDILDQEWISQFDNGDAKQTIPIVFGDENMEFLFDLEEYIGRETNGQYTYETMLAAKNITMTLHGTEEIVATLPNTFFLEFMLFDKALIEDKTDISFFKMAYDPNPLSIKSSNSITKNQVIASDIGVSTVFPSTYAWVTKIEGDYESLAHIYHITPDEFKTFMEQQGHSIMAADQNSDIRVSISSYLASIDIKNYSLQTDAQLIEEAQSSVGSFESVLGATDIDIWVLRNDKLAFVCIMYKMPLMNQYQIICGTCIDGYFYQVTLRGSESEMLRKVAEEIVFYTEIQEKDRELLQIATGNINLLLPLHWELDSQNITEEGLKAENIAFRVHADDGSSDIAVITITDLMPYLDSNGSAEDRRIFDQVYAQVYFDLVLPQISTHTQEVDYISIHDYNFALLSHPTIDEYSYLFGTGYGYAFHIIYSKPFESILVEPRFEDTKELVAEIISLYQQ